MRIRAERAEDREAVAAIHRAAFETPLEAELVEALRDQARPFVSLVADDDGTVVGHVLFTPVAVVDSPELKLMGLAPMAVLPARQRQGIGTALASAGIEECRRLGFGAVVVLGHPDYYPRFGFTPASGFGLTCEYDAPPEAFLACELRPGYLDGASGTVAYHRAFGGA